MATPDHEWRENGKGTASTTSALAHLLGLSGSIKNNSKTTDMFYVENADVATAAGNPLDRNTSVKLGVHTNRVAFITAAGTAEVVFQTD